MSASEPQKTSDPESVRDPEPKIYAPLLLQLENEHPKLAPLLIGVGDQPVAYDARKREVEARFQTEAGTPFSGKYHTEPATADTDAKEFLQRMVGKFEGATSADRKVLGESPPAPEPVPSSFVPEPPPSVEPPSAETEPEPVVSEVGEADGADDADWNEPTKESERQ
jgi:hypothetical protein